MRLSLRRVASGGQSELQELGQEQCCGDQQLSAVHLADQRTAFSPTDTMPLTVTAKIVMGLQSTSALLTVGLAVDILG